MTASKWINLGAVGKPHGLKGAFFISGRSEALNLSLKGASLAVGTDPENSLQVSVDHQTDHRDTSVLQLSAWVDRSTVEQHRGESLWIRREAIPVDETREYLWNDLIGMTVISQGSNIFGEITGVANFGATDIVAIKHGDCTIEIPLVDAYFDLSFKARDRQIMLTADPEIFADQWA